MALTGRTALLAALGSPPRRFARTQLAGGCRRQLPLAVAMMCDYALAAPVRKLRFTRSGDTHVRQGEMAETSLQLTNTSSRPLRALLRDAWPPSNAVPGTTDAARHRVEVPAAWNPRAPYPTPPHAQGRSRRTQRHRPLVRTPGTRLPPGDAPRSWQPPRPAAVPQPPPARCEDSPPARAGRADQRARQGRGHRVRQSAQVRSG